jgi:hypothetical protein
MATRNATTAQVRKSGHSQPERPDRQAGPDLGVLDRRHLLARAHRRQSRALITLTGIVVAASLVLAAGGRALVASDQVRSDTLQSQIAAALQVQQDDQLQKAELVAPARILTIAETHLHMVTPAVVTYLPPVNPGETVAQAHDDPTASGHRSSSGSTTASQPPK